MAGFWEGRPFSPRRRWGLLRRRVRRALLVRRTSTAIAEHTRLVPHAAAVIGDRCAGSLRDIRATLHDYSRDALHIVHAGLKASPHAAAEFSHAVVTGRPESYLWAHLALLLECSRKGSGLVADDTLTELLNGLIEDPETAPLVNAVSGPYSERVSALAAVCLFGQRVIAACPEQPVPMESWPHRHAWPHWRSHGADRGGAVLLRAVHAGRPVIRLAHPGLAYLVASRPQDAERIAEIAAARRTCDADAIEAVLDAPTGALSDGAL